MNLLRSAFFVAAALMLLASSTAEAHRLGESYVYLSVSEGGLTGRLEITTQDLNKAFPLDKDGDQSVSNDEFAALAGEIEANAQSRLIFYVGDEAYPIEVTRSRIHSYNIADFAKIFFRVPSLHPVPDWVDVEYRFMFDGFDDGHRSLLVIENNTRTGWKDNEWYVSLIITPGKERQSLSLIGTPWHHVFGSFMSHGVEHILGGLDHVLFIICLLLPAAMTVQQRRWVPVERFQTAFWFVVKIVTLFTIAHSVTLSLSALKIISLPVNLVESVIAASIIVVALNNLYPLIKQHIWPVVFLFGLFHGLGFANVLAPLGPEKDSLLTALVGFNVGVEIGQLAIVLVAFPLVFWARNWKHYPLVVLKLGSVLLIGIAGYWFVQRAFGL